MLRTAGMPDQILAPYMQMLNNLDVYTVFSRHIGQAHRYRAGIPQGCPFSMMLNPFLMSAVVAVPARTCVMIWGKRGERD